MCPFKRIFPSNKLVPAVNNLKTLYPLNAKNTHMTENLQILMQSTFPGVLAGKICIGV